MAVNTTPVPKVYSDTWYRVTGFIGRVILNLVLILISVACLVPFFVVLSASVSTETALVNNGYSLFPTDFTLAAYRYLLVDSAQVLQSYLISLIVTAIGSPLGLLIMSLVAYAMSRKHFKYRKAVAFYIFFTMLFSGGLVPSYILVTQYLHLKDTIDQDFWYKSEPVETDIKERPYKALMVIIGSSDKGLGASGITIDQEIARLQKMVKTAKDGKLPIDRVRSIFIAVKSGNHDATILQADFISSTLKRHNGTHRCLIV